MALDEDGAIRAHVGGRDYDTLQVDLARGVDGGGSGRQPGSTFKPFVLAGRPRGRAPPSPTRTTARRRSRSTSAARRSRSRTTAARASASSPLAEATARSVNTVYAQLLAQVGPAAVADAAEQPGIDADLDLVPSIALGAEEVSPQDLASAFLTFANDGTRVEPYAIARIEDGDGNVLWEPDRPEPEEDAVDPDVSRTVTEALRGVIDHGTGTAADIGRPAAGKTGTTQDNVDAWFAGYVPGYTAVVWMGYPDPTPMDGVTGGGMPAEIWQRFMSAAMEGRDAGGLPRPARRPPPPGPGRHVDHVVELVELDVVDRRAPRRTSTTAPDGSTTSTTDPDGTTTTSETTTTTVAGATDEGAAGPDPP